MRCPAGFSFQMACQRCDKIMQICDKSQELFFIPGMPYYIRNLGIQGNTKGGPLYRKRNKTTVA